MRVVIFCHSLISDWNHGNAHFRRDVCIELLSRRHEVLAFEPQDAWSVQNLVAEHGEEPIARFQQAYPQLRSERYHLPSLDLDRALQGADLALVHERNDHDLVRRIGEHRARSRRYRLLFHDTHHRAVTDPEAMGRYDLRHYDGVLTFGEVIRDLYLRRGWTQQAWTWHEAADVRVFHPHEGEPPEGDLVWIGNWGADERTAELHELFIEPAKALGLRGKVYGVRYPTEGGPSGLRASQGDGARASPAVCPGAPGAPHHHARRGLPGREHRRRDEEAAAARPGGPGPRPRVGRAGAQDDPRAPHLRAPLGPAPRDPRAARRKRSEGVTG